jgi:hypothetical protein
LEQYYKFSNEPIRAYKEDKTKFEGIRNVMLEEKIANELIRRFSKIRLDHEAILKQFQDAAKRQQEAATTKTKVEETNTTKPKEETKK